MPIRIAPIDGIISGIGVAVDVDAGEDGVPGGGREGEPANAELGVVIAGVEILQARLGIEAFVDIGLAVQHRGAVGGQRLAKGAIVVGGGGRAAHERHPAIGSEMVLVQPGRDAAFSLDIGVDVGGEDARIAADGAVEQHLGIAAQIAGGEGAEGLGGTLAVRPIGEAGDVAVGGDGDGVKRGGLPSNRSSGPI